MRITAKGQVTIPQEIRDQLGFLPETEVDFQVDGNTVRLVKVKPRRGLSRGQTAIQRLRGSSDVKMTTEEILALTRK